MPRKSEVVVKYLKKIWFPALLIVIVAIFFWNQEVAIWITGIAIVLFVLSYLPSLLKRGKVIKVMKEFFMIEDDTLARTLKKSIKDTREILFNISRKKSNGKKWLIVFLNKRYTFYHQQTIDIFKDLYRKGYGDKEILDALKKNDLQTRNEIKSITEALSKQNHLPSREVGVKERREKVLSK